jgi:hypothetical protein
MKHNAWVPTLAVLAVALVALLTAYLVTQGTPHRGGAVPSHEIVNQQVVQAPPLNDSGAAAARSSVMGGPPAGSHGGH